MRNSSNYPNLPYGRTVIPVRKIVSDTDPNHIWLDLHGQKTICVTKDQYPNVVRMLGTRIPTPESPKTYLDVLASG